MASAANIAGGVTIDLSTLNSIVLNADHSTVSVGVGATWDAVYSKLDMLNLSVAGGRAAGVGVGGLTLGGGISYFSPRYGWTCDGVSNFQVVLSDGSIINANTRHNSDLVFALRGGSNNFGIVTRIDFQTFSQGLLWGGNTYHPLNQAIIDTEIQGFVKLNSEKSYDEYASLITAWAFSSAQGSLSLNQLVYTKPTKEPEVFRDFLSLPRILSTTRIANMTDLSLETEAFQPIGLRCVDDFTICVLLTCVLT